MFRAACVISALFVFGARSANATDAVTIEEARSIAKEATIYGFPLVDNYRVQHSYLDDSKNPEYKAPWNTLSNTARVYTPEDKAIQSPNSDTPYSFLGADLRAEPLVISVPAVEEDRYYSLQFIDMYTFNFAYVGSRATGNGAGRHLLVGPNWKGSTPKGMSHVIRSETDFAFVLYRTQLFNPADIGNLKRVQAGYQVETLSRHLGNAPAPAAVPVNFIAPLSKADERTSLDFFKVLNFVLDFCPTDPSEKPLMERFAQIGVGAGKHFDADALTPEVRRALRDGMADAWKTFSNFKKDSLDTGMVSSADSFGSREHLHNNYLLRMAAAAIGNYGNSKQEAIYPVYFVDAKGEKLDGTRRYTLRFVPGQLPPVNAFWSLTLYQLPSSLLYANELNRYLINSSMLPALKRDPDGGITLHIQNESPGPEYESNWLPAPPGPFLAAMRLYWPKPAAYDGQWHAPKVESAATGAREH